MLSGFINIRKTSGLSSNKALGILKYHLKQNNIDTKVGHFGTLDPLAEGVLPVALGRATRLFDYFLDKEKIYVATFTFGQETDTLDCTGTVVAEGRNDVTAEEINAVIPSLVGEVLQVPPAYSAKSIDGVRAYKLARKGEEVVLAPKKVRIDSIELIEQVSKDTFRFRITCGGGTYIRSIVRDMAYAMNTVGYMSTLCRTKSGKFTLDTASTVDELGVVSDKILPMSFLTDGFPRIDLTDAQYSSVKNGVPIDMDMPSDVYYSVYYQGILLGIGSISDKKMIIKTWLL